GKSVAQLSDLKTSSATPWATPIAAQNVTMLITNVMRSFPSVGLRCTARRPIRIPGPTFLKTIPWKRAESESFENILPVSIDVEFGFRSSLFRWGGTTSLGKAYPTCSGAARPMSGEEEGEQAAGDRRDEAEREITVQTPAR